MTTEELSRKATQFDHERRSLCREMHELIKKGAYQEALAIADALIPIYDVELHGLCNALWVVQNDNTGLPFDEQRGRRYLAATLLRAPHNPEMHLNASGVLMELGEPEAAMRQLLLAKKREVDLAPHLDEPLLAPLKSHRRWSELVDGLRESVEDVTWVEVVEDCFQRGAYNDAVPAIVKRWRQTHSTRLADLLDAIAHETGERSGYCAGRIEAAIVKEPTRLAWEVDQGTRWRVEEKPHEVWLLYDLEDPRFSSALISILVANPRQPAKKLVQQGWQALMRNVAAARDRRLIAPLRELSGWVEAMNPGVVGATMRQTFAEAARRIEEADFSEGLSAEEEACLSRLEEAIPRAPDPFRLQIETPAAAAAPQQSDDLLELWRRTRSPRVAELMLLREMRQPSLQLESEVRALDPRIDLWEYDSDSIRGEDAAQLIWEKRHQGADPRVVEQLVQLLREPPFIYPRAENGVENFWVELMDTLQSFEDVRALEPLRAFEKKVHALCKDADEVAKEEMYTSHPLGGFLRRETKEVIRHLESLRVEALGDEERATVEALEAEYEPERRARQDAGAAEADWQTRERELFRAVLNDPDSDAARLAYAGHLDQRNDPYGEFIRLQIDDRDPERQQELLDAHEGRFLGVLANVVSRAKFERGFVAECRIDKFKLESTETRDLPLHTIGCLRLDSMDWQRYDPASDDLVTNDSLFDFVCHPAFVSLRHVEGVTPAALQLLVQRGWSGVETLTFDIDNYTEVDWGATLAALHQLSALRRVRASIYSPDYFEATRPLLAGELPEQVEAIALSVGERGRIEVWSDIFDAWSKTRFPSFVVSSRDVEARFVRDGEKISVRVEQKDDVGSILGVIVRLPANSIQVFRHTVADGVTGPDAVQLQKLERALCRHSNIDFSLPPPSAKGRDVEAELLAGWPSVEELCKRAPEDDFAIGALGYLRAEEGVDVLIDIIRNQDHRTRQDAAFRALGRIGSMKSVAPLTEIVREAFGTLDKVDFKRFEGLDALGQIGAAESLKWLRRALREGDTYDARSATAGLAIHGEPADVTLIEQAIAKEGEREAIRFHIPLYTLDPGRCEPDGARRVVESFGTWWRTDLRERLVQCFVRLAQRLPAEKTEVRAIFREGLRHQIRLWKVYALEDQIDSFSPARACWLQLVERLAEAWDIDSAL